MTAVQRSGALTLLTPQESETLARRVIEMANGSQAQVEVFSNGGSSLEFARGDTHLGAERTSVSVRLALEVAGDRHASGSTDQVDEAGLHALVREVRALTQAQRTTRKWSEDDFPSILPPQVYPASPPTFFDTTMDAGTGEVQAEVFRQALDATEAAGLIAAGDVRIGAHSRAVLNTRGLWAYQRSSFGKFSLTARTQDGTGSGWGWSGYEDWARVKVDEVIARAVDLGRRSANPVAVEPGRYTVILEPTAVAELLEPIIGLPTAYWSAQAADGGGTVFSSKPVGTNKIGRQMLDRRLGMVSDPWDPERPAGTIGNDWRPIPGPVTWFQAGVLRNLAYPPAYARAKGRQPVFNPGGVRLTGDGPSQTLEEMIASTKRGLWVNRLSGVVEMNRPTLLLTGTTRDGTFLIENGKITKAVKNLRFTDSPFFVLNQVEAWGEPVRASYGAVAPRLKVRDFDFTSLTDAV